jgi:hypothetical protein
MNKESRMEIIHIHREHEIKEKPCTSLSIKCYKCAFPVHIASNSRTTRCDTCYTLYNKYQIKCLLDRVISEGIPIVESWSKGETEKSPKIPNIRKLKFLDEENEG